MEKLIVFLDIDGTIVSHHKMVSKKVQYAIQKARSNGHYVILCTGRNKVGIQEYISIGFDGYICNSGAYINICQTVIFDTFFKRDDIKKIICVLHKYHIDYHLESVDITFQSLSMNNRFLKRRENISSLTDNMRNNFNKQYHICLLDQYHYEPIQKITFMAKERKDIEQMQKVLSHQFNIILHDIKLDDRIHGEIIMTGIHKGFAVLKVMKYLCLPIENTIGFGDSMNDLEMIKTCFIGVAMKNGSLKLQNHADSICESVDEDGVYFEFLRRGII